MRDVQVEHLPEQTYYLAARTKNLENLHAGPPPTCSLTQRLYSRAHRNTAADCRSDWVAPAALSLAPRSKSQILIDLGIEKKGELSAFWGLAPLEREIVDR